MRIMLFLPFCCLLFSFVVSAAEATANIEELLRHPLPVTSSNADPSNGQAINPANDGIFHAPPIRVRVAAERHTVLSGQLAGRIAALPIRDGDRFRKGDLLLRIDCTVMDRQLDRAKALRRRQELLYEMTRELAALQSKGELEVELAKAELDQAEADVAATEAMLKRASIIAPFTGRVMEVGAREEQFVSEGQPLIEIVDDNELTIEFIAPSNWVAWFTPGYRFSVVIQENGKTYQAELDRLGGKVDPLSQSVKAYARLRDPSPDLMMGMSGEARIDPPEKP